MHEILVISGKGGTGKTSLTAAFAHLAVDPIICDLDVDAPDLHILLAPEKRQINEFYSGFEAAIEPAKCEACDICGQMCQFNAIQPGDPCPSIDPLKCEGCKVCVQFCPVDAIAFTHKHCGAWYVSNTRFGAMVHAQLFPGEENSGRLIALLRKEAKAMAKQGGKSLILADGTPGIGCPVISALSGVDLAVVVTEPTMSGLHDMGRITALCDHFKIPVAVIINKCDLNEEMAGRIEETCRHKSLQLVARLPHDPDFTYAMIKGKAITEFACGDTVQGIKKAWDQILTLVNSGGRSMSNNQERRIAS